MRNNFSTLARSCLNVSKIARITKKCNGQKMCVLLYFTTFFFGTFLAPIKSTSLAPDARR